MNLVWLNIEKDFQLMKKEKEENGEKQDWIRIRRRMFR